MSTTIEGEIGFAIAGASGCELIDERGERWLDVTAGSGALALGHGHPSVVAAMSEQLGRFTHGGWQLTSPARAELTGQLCDIARVPEPRVLLTTTGSEAVEAALKMARAATGRRQILGFLGGFHGKTSGSLGVTASASLRHGIVEQPTAVVSLPYPAATGYLSIDAPQTRGCDFGQRILTHPDFGLNDIAAIIVEGVQGAGGMSAAAPGFLSELRDFTRAHGILLILDEIYTGLGRTGRLWCADHETVAADITVAGKALGGGLPIGAVIARRGVADALRPLQQTSTFSGNPVACAGGCATLEIIQERGLSQRGSELGGQFASAAAKLSRPELAVEVRGRGLMIGLRLRPTCGEARTLTDKVNRGLRRRHVLALRGGADGDVIKVTPPLTIDWPRLAQFLDAIDASIQDALQDA